MDNMLFVFVFLIYFNWSDTICDGYRFDPSYNHELADKENSWTPADVIYNNFRSEHLLR